LTILYKRKRKGTPTSERGKKEGVLLPPKGAPSLV